MSRGFFSPYQPEKSSLTRNQVIFISNIPNEIIKDFGLSDLSILDRKHKATHPPSQMLKIYNVQFCFLLLSSFSFLREKPVGSLNE